VRHRHRQALVSKEVPRAFVSYTAEDLGDHATVVVEHITRMGWIPVDHRLWDGDGSFSVERCEAEVGNADIFVLLVAHRYGWTPKLEQKGDGKTSITWREYKCALRLGKPLVLFMLSEKEAGWPTERYETLPDGKPPPGLAEFRREIKERATAFFDRQPLSVLKTLEIGLRRAQSQIGSSPEVLRGEYAQGFPTYRGDLVSVMPGKLHYLCDRSTQVKLLRVTVQEHIKADTRRPLLLVVHGDASEAHGAFIERIEKRILSPVVEEAAGAAAKGPRTRDQFLYPMGVKPAEASFVSRLRSGIAERFDRTELESDTALLQCLEAHGLRTAMVVLELRSSECGTTPEAVLAAIHDYWRNFPELPASLGVMCVVSLKYDYRPGGAVTHLLQKVFQRPTHAARLREALASFEQSARGEAMAPVYVLPELTSISKAEFAEWMAHVRDWIDHVSEIEIDGVFGPDSVATMDEVIEFVNEKVKSKSR
jgi:hypothetical protein